MLMHKQRQPHWLLKNRKKKTKITNLTTTDKNDQQIKPEQKSLLTAEPMHKYAWDGATWHNHNENWYLSN